MAKTPTPFNVNSSTWTPYVVQSPAGARKIVVSEVNQAGTTDYLIAYPTSADGPRTRPAGKEFVFEPGGTMSFGSTPFYLKAVSGSVDFDSDEQ